jgi:hypothetical protein
MQHNASVALSVILAVSALQANEADWKHLDQVKCDRAEIVVEGKKRDYCKFSANEPVSLTVQGNAILKIRTRLGLPPGSEREKEYKISIVADGRESKESSVTTQTAVMSTLLPDSSDVTQAKNVYIDVPEGTHTYTLRLVEPEDGKGYVRFYSAPSELIPISFSSQDHDSTGSIVDKEKEQTYHRRSDEKGLLDARFSYGIGLGYDDNIFRYSPEDIDKFVNNEDSRCFSNTESYDDLVTREQVTVELRKRLWMGEKTKLRVKYTRNQYSVNPIKNYQSVILNLRQDILKKNFLQIGYLVLPRFYIRDYYDSDMKLYTRCDFLEHLIALKIGRRISRETSAAIIYKWEVLDYNSHFTEYDTRANLFGGSITQKFLKNGTVEVGYLYKDANAKGYDQDGETVLTSDESDISYGQHAGDVDVIWRIGKKTPLSVKGSYRYEYRTYTTEKSVEDDPFHFGRKDTKQTIRGSLNLKMTSNLSANVSYTYKQRCVDSPNKDEITEVKDYTNHCVSMGFNVLII